MSRNPSNVNDDALAAAAESARRTRRVTIRPANHGPLIVLAVLAIVGCGALVVFLAARSRNAEAQAQNISSDAGPAAPKVGDTTAGRTSGTTIAPPRPITPPTVNVDPAQQSPISVTLISAEVAPVKLVPRVKSKPSTAPVSKVFGRPPEPEEQPRLSEPFLCLRVRVTNNGKTPIAYRPWTDAAPVLADDARNVYAFCKFTTYVPDAYLAPSPQQLAAGQSIEETLIFERPPRSARTLELRLPGSHLNLPHMLVVPLPPAQIAGL